MSWGNAKIAFPSGATTPIEIRRQEIEGARTRSG
jgi:hypothetical protein